MARRRLGLGILVAVDGLWLATQGVLRGGARWAPVLVVVALHLGLVWAERRRPTLDPSLVLKAVALVAAISVVAPAFGSRDLYLYATYGRMVSEHGLNPHLVGPGAIPTDPVAALAEPEWADTPSLYGPFFTLLSTIGSLGFGTSPLLARLYFQALAGLALVGGCALLRRRGAASWVLLAVGSSPALLVTVNGGHNDLVAGFLVLVGIDLVARHRARSGACVLAAACLVKVLAGPAVLAVAVALAASGRRRQAVQVVTIVTGLLLAGYAAVGGRAAASALWSLGDDRSRASPWSLITGLVAGDGPSWVGTASMVVLGVAGTVLVHRAWRGRLGGAELAASLGVVVCFGASYSLPWYPAVFLLLAASVPGAVAHRALHVGSVALLLAYVQPPGRLTTDLIGAPSASIVAALVLVSCVVSTVADAGRAGEPSLGCQTPRAP